jgi:hypothetical protein
MYRVKRSVNMDKAGKVDERAGQAVQRSKAGSSRAIRRTFVALGVALAAFGAALFASSAAEAQEWLKDRMYQEGAGVRTGDLEWHPGIGVQGGYDSNYLLRSNQTTGCGPGGCINGPPTAPVVGSPELQVTPSLSLATLGPQRREGDTGGAPPPTIGFRLNAAGTYREFFGQIVPEQRNFSADVNARLDILPEHPLGGAVFASYDRTIQPNAVNGDPDLSFNRDTVGVGAELGIQPGSGTLDWHFGYQFTDTLFEEAAGQPYSNFSNQAYTRGRWKFRPRTALVYDASIAFFHYDNTVAAGANAGDAGAVSPLLNSTPVRSRIGMSGLITPRLSFLGMVGYGGSFFYPATKTDAVQQYDSVIGQAELKYYVTAQPGNGEPITLTLSSVAVGYSRDFVDSYLADFYGTDRGYLKFSYFFAGRALISLEGGLGAIEYPTVTFLDPGTAPHAGFTDVRVDTTLYGEYRFTNFFGLNLTAKYTDNISNTVLNIGPPNPGGVDQFLAMQWQRFEIYAGVRLFL